jgi:hypothetical protein
MQAFIESEQRIRLRLKLLAGALCVTGLALAVAIIFYNIFTWGRWMGAAMTLLLFVKAAFETVTCSPSLSLEAEKKRMENARARLDPVVDEANYAWLSAQIEFTQETNVSYAEFMAERERERRLNQ